MKGLRTVFARFAAWLKVSRTHQLIFAAVAVVLVGTLSFVAYSMTRSNNTQSPTPTQQIAPSQPQDTTTLYIESNIPGIIMAGAPYCDAAKANKTTPYECTLQKDQTETVITAPAEATHEGKTYVFKTWDGCSEGNEDWKICKVKTDAATTKNIVATYAEKQVATTKPPTQKPAVPAIPNKAPVCAGQDSTDPSFASCRFTLTDTPAKTVVVLRTYATECGKQMQGNLSLTHPAPCQKQYAGYHTMYEPDASSVISCDIAFACVIDVAVTATHNDKRVTANSPTGMILKIPRESTLHTRTYCRYGCAPIQGTFSELEYTYDTDTKTFTVTVFYTFKALGS